MKFEEKIVDRQVGRNADLFARTIGEMPTIEERYPYIRILISIVEQAHPEWNQAPTRDHRIALLIFHMSKGAINQDETAEIVRLRDEERGFTYIEKEKKAAKQAAKQAESAADASEKKAEDADAPAKESADSATKDAEKASSDGDAAKTEESRTEASPKKEAESNAETDASAEAGSDEGSSAKSDEQDDTEKPVKAKSKSENEPAPDDDKS